MAREWGREDTSPHWRGHFAEQHRKEKELT
jgi:hypothetical protein